jgi:hypothetical protein
VDFTLWGSKECAKDASLRSSVATVWFGLVFQASSPNLEPSVWFKKARWLNLNHLFGLVWFWFGSARFRFKTGFEPIF